MLEHFGFLSTSLYRTSRLPTTEVVPGDFIDCAYRYCEGKVNVSVTGKFIFPFKDY